MAVSSYIPQTLAEMKKVNQVTAERWIKDNASLGRGYGGKTRQLDKG